MRSTNWAKEDTKSVNTVAGEMYDGRINEFTASDHSTQDYNVHEWNYLVLVSFTNLKAFPKEQ